MPLTDLTIKDCDKKFADMVLDMKKLFSMRVKAAIRVNFSGDPTQFNYKFLELEPDAAFKLIEKLEPQDSK